MTRPARPPRSSRTRRPEARIQGADLHVHTTHSDGGCSPGEVVRAASNVGLAAVAITDHDTVSAVPLARAEAARLGVELVAGVELTAVMDGRELHILGHFVRDDDPDLVAATEQLRRARVDRIEAMAGRLAGLGLEVDLAAIRATFPRATIGRKHLADWLTRSGQVATYRDAFTLYLHDGGPADVPKPRLPVERAIGLIRGAGGVAGLAHPPYDLRLGVLEELAEAGLGSIEVDGPGIDARLGSRWRAWADQMGLAVTAGSDFHASDRPGRWVGSVRLGDVELDRLRDRHHNHVGLS